MPKFQIESDAPKVTKKQLEKLEQHIGKKLPESYRQFLSKYNGGTVEPDCFDVPKWEGQASMLSVIFGVTDDSSDDIFEMLEDYDDRLPKGFIPIADDAGGNLLLLKLSNGAIYFWDYEGELTASGTSNKSGSNTYLLAESIDEFLNGLYEGE